MFFVDANIFLEVELNDEKSGECEKLLEKVCNNQINAATSDFVVYTCLIQLEKKSASIEKMRDFMMFMDNASLEIHSPTFQTLYNTFEIMKKQTLDFDDALVVAIMKSVGIKEIISFDKHFDKVKEIKRLEPNQVLTE